MVAVVEFAVSVLQLGALGTVFGVGAAAVWTPFLSSSRVRTLFATIGRSDNWPASYLVVLTGIGTAEFLLFAAVGLLGDALYSLPGTDTPAENAFFWQGLLVGYGICLLLLWVIPVVILPRVGIDWDSHEYDMTTKALLGAGVLWYQVGGAVAAVFISSIVYSSIVL
jgi:hypothetical protein